MEIKILCAPETTLEQLRLIVWGERASEILRILPLANGAYEVTVR